MSRLTLILILLSSFFMTNRIQAQQTFKQVDSISYQLYTEQNWDKLVEFGEQAIDDGYDYFYMNLRLGIAYFYKKDYKSSLVALKKANKSNSYSQTTITFIFWNYYYLLNDKQALRWYDKIDQSSKNVIRYEPGKKLNSIYAEGGVKITNSDSMSNMSYYNIFLEHHIAGRFDLKESYSYNSQKLNWGTFTQHQFYINPIFNINRKSRINIAVNGVLYNSKLSYESDNSYTRSFSSTTGSFPLQTTTTTDSVFSNKYVLDGTYQEQNIFIQPRFSRKWEYFGIAPYATYYGIYQKPNYSETYSNSLTVRETQSSTVLSEQTTTSDSIALGQPKNLNQYNVGVNIYGNYKFLTIGSDFKYILNNGNYYFFYSPFIKAKIGYRLEISSYYFSKKDYVVSLFEGASLINSYTNLTRLSATASFKFNKKFKGYVTYQNEKAFDNFNNQDYKFNSFYLGLKYKL